MSNSPVPGFHPLSTEFTEKWHAQADIDDPPFKRPMLAQMAHMEARQRGEVLADRLRDTKTVAHENAHLATEHAQAALYRVVSLAALLLGLVWASLLPSLVVGVSAGACALAMTLCFFVAARRRKELFAVVALGKKETDDLTAQKLAAEKEAGEHWNKFVKLTTEADSKIKVLQDAPVEQK